MKEIKVQDKFLQPQGIETGRTLRHALLAAWIPMGNSAAGYDRVCLCKMWYVHHFGGIIFPFLVRHEQRLARLYLRLHKVRG